MTMDSALATATPSLDIGTLLARVNQRIALLRTWISHDHGDQPYWWARRTTASRAQAERAALRHVADALHIERATARGRIHGTRFASLDEQRALIAKLEHGRCVLRASLLGLPDGATLAQLREGKLPL
jgi:hypothetical protein